MKLIIYIFRRFIFFFYKGYMISKADRMAFDSNGKKCYFVVKSGWKLMIISSRAHKIYNNKAKKQGKQQINYHQLMNSVIYRTK